MGNIGVPELLVIALIALLLFGAGRLADIGKGLGQGIKNFKEGIKDADKEGAADDKAEKKPAQDAKASKDTKDTKDSKDDKESKSSKDSKESKEEAAKEA